MATNTKKVLEDVKVIIGLLESADKQRFKELISSMKYVEKLLLSTSEPQKVVTPIEPPLAEHVSPVKVEEVGLPPKRSSGGKVSPVKA